METQAIIFIPVLFVSLCLSFASKKSKAQETHLGEDIIVSILISPIFPLSFSIKESHKGKRKGKEKWERMLTVIMISSLFNFLSLRAIDFLLLFAALW